MTNARKRARVVVRGVAAFAVVLLETVVIGCSSTKASSAASSDASEAPGEDDDADTPGDATHKDDQPAPSATYACALEGGFGWLCTLDASGPDPGECTDPRFPICFAGGQGARCTAECGDGGVAACPAASGGGTGCIPSDCNARGYCK
jgi:hypothetical protein